MCNSPCFRPLSWGLSFNEPDPREYLGGKTGFRPLSWGLSFNDGVSVYKVSVAIVFVPFLGDFLSMATIEKSNGFMGNMFSSPFLGTFFQYF